MPHLASGRRSKCALRLRRQLATQGRSDRVSSAGMRLVPGLSRDQLCGDVRLARRSWVNPGNLNWPGNFGLRTAQKFPTFIPTIRSQLASTWSTMSPALLMVQPSTCDNRTCCDTVRPVGTSLRALLIPRCRDRDPGGPPITAVQMHILPVGSCDLPTVTQQFCWVSPRRGGSK